MDKALTRWLTVEQAAIRAGVTPEAIIERIKSGELKAYYFAVESETVH